MSVGGHCSKCHRNEQQCAVDWPCCMECHHWRGLNDNGEPIRSRREPSTEERLALIPPEILHATVAVDEPEPAEDTPDLSSPYFTDPLYLELLHHRLPPVDNSDGPTARFMHRERARLLWQLAREDKSAPVVPAMDNGEVA